MLLLYRNACHKIVAIYIEKIMTILRIGYVHTWSHTHIFEELRNLPGKDHCEMAANEVYE